MKRARLEKSICPQRLLNHGGGLFQVAIYAFELRERGPMSTSAQRLVDEYAQRILRVAENQDKAYLYQFKLTDLSSKNAIGMSVGNHIIYIDYGRA